MRYVPVALTTVATAFDFVSWDGVGSSLAVLRLCKRFMRLFLKYGP
jgi:hypothetical protein